MEFYLIGYKIVDFTDDKGNRLYGTKVYFKYDDSDVNGEATDEGWIPADTIDPETIGLHLGDSCIPIRNKKGRLQNLLFL